MDTWVEVLLGSLPLVGSVIGAAWYLRGELAKVKEDAQKAVAALRDDVDDKIATLSTRARQEATEAMRHEVGSLVARMSSLEDTVELHQREQSKSWEDVNRTLGRIEGMLGATLPPIPRRPSRPGT